MRLAEVIDRIHSLPAEGTIFAERIEGTFSPNSRCAVLELSDDELEQPLCNVSAHRALGLEYFLEVDIAVNLLETLEARGAAAATAFLIRYAENDA